MNRETGITSADLISDGSAKGFEIDGESFFALRFAGQIHVYRNSCPHLGVELNWLPDQFFDLDGRYIQCASHGALFDPANGRCLGGPCRGQSLQAVAHFNEGEKLHIDMPPPNSVRR